MKSHSSNHQVTAITCLIIITLGLCSCELIRDARVRELQIIYSRLVNNHDYDSAARLFHFPENISEQEYSSEKDRIAKCIESVSEELGTIERVVSVPEYGSHRISFSGAGAEYWENIPFYTAAHFPVKLRDSGEGWMEINYFKESWRTLSIRKISFRISPINHSLKEKIEKYGGTYSVIDMEKESSRYLY